MVMCTMCTMCVQYRNGRLSEKSRRKEITIHYKRHRLEVALAKREATDKPGVKNPSVDACFAVA